MNDHFVNPLNATDNRRNSQDSTGARPYKSLYPEYPCCSKLWIHHPMESSPPSEDLSQNQPGGFSTAKAPGLFSLPCAQHPSARAPRWKLIMSRARFPRLNHRLPVSGGWLPASDVSGALQAVGWDDIETDPRQEHYSRFSGCRILCGYRLKNSDLSRDIQDNACLLRRQASTMGL